MEAALAAEREPPTRYDAPPHRARRRRTREDSSVYNCREIRHDPPRGPREGVDRAGRSYNRSGARGAAVEPGTLAGVCDRASTLSQTCLHAARVARGDACVARVLNDDAIGAARACLDRLNGDKHATNFFEGLEAHARKEADILAKSSNAAEKILSRRLKGAFRVKLPTDCSQDSLRWAARLAIAIASELRRRHACVFIIKFWAAGPGAAWRVWRDGISARCLEGHRAAALALSAAKAASSSQNAPGPQAAH